MQLPFSLSPQMFTVTLSTFLPNLPEKVAAEDEAQHKDKKADAQHNDVYVEREVIDVRRHAAVVFRALRTQTTQASWQEEFTDTDYILVTLNVYGQSLVQYIFFLFKIKYCYI